MSSDLPHKKPQVLIVEDDPINLFVACKLLEKYCDIQTATNDKEAFDCLKANGFDVILMDINLGAESLDGVEVMRRIKEQDPQSGPPIFAVTSYAMPEDEEKYLNAGFDRYFAKPIERHRIIDAIQGALG